MAKYLISFPSAAMVVTEAELAAASDDSHAVIEDAKAAGVYVFGGGIDEGVPPVLVSADGSVAEGGYPSGPKLDGGFCVLELPTREDPMVARLLARKGPGANPDYGVEPFERALDRRWRVERREPLPSGTRILYRATPAA